MVAGLLKLASLSPSRITFTGLTLVTRPISNQVFAGYPAAGERAGQIRLSQICMGYFPPFCVTHAIELETVSHAADRGINCLLPGVKPHDLVRGERHDSVLHLDFRGGCHPG